MTHKLIQPWTSRPRLVFSSLLALAIFFVIPVHVAAHDATKFIISWNVGALFYLLLTFRMMVSSTHEDMKKRAVAQNTGRFLVLLMVFVAAVVCIASTVTSLSIAKELHGMLKGEHIALASLTVFTSWFFTQAMFAQHYAHAYYFAVSHHQDSFTSSSMRRIGTAHGLLSFFFNTVLIALTINIGSGLI